MLNTEVALSFKALAKALLVTLCRLRRLIVMEFAGVVDKLLIEHNFLCKHTAI